MREYTGSPMFTLSGPLVNVILTGAHIGFRGHLQGYWELEDN